MMNQQPNEQEKPGDCLVNCCFRDRKSVRNLADQLVEQQPSVFPDRASVFRKGFHLLIKTLELNSNERIVKPPTD